VDRAVFNVGAYNLLKSARFLHNITQNINKNVFIKRHYSRGLYFYKDLAVPLELSKIYANPLDFRDDR
jgi:hypothetical protein